MRVLRIGSDEKSHLNTRRLVDKMEFTGLEFVQAELETEFPLLVSMKQRFLRKKSIILLRQRLHDAIEYPVRVRYLFEGKSINADCGVEALCLLHRRSCLVQIVDFRVLMIRIIIELPLKKLLSRDGKYRVKKTDRITRIDKDFSARLMESFHVFFGIPYVFIDFRI